MNVLFLLIPCNVTIGEHWMSLKIWKAFIWLEMVMDFCGQVTNYPLRVSLPHILPVIIPCHYYLSLFLKKKVKSLWRIVHSLFLPPPLMSFFSFSFLKKNWITLNWIESICILAGNHSQAGWERRLGHCTHLAGMSDWQTR